MVKCYSVAQVNAMHAEAIGKGMYAQTLIMKGGRVIPSFQSGCFCIVVAESTAEKLAESVTIIRERRFPVG